MDRMLLLVLLLAVAKAQNGLPVAKAGLAIEQDVLNKLHDDDAESGDVCFEYAEIDLNGDGVDEVLVLATAEPWCGSGGCTLMVYERSKDALEEVSSTTLVREVFVSRATTRGWRDLFVTDRYGKWLLSFDGKTYPLNPTVAPAKKVTTIPDSAEAPKWIQARTCK